MKTPKAVLASFTALCAACSGSSGDGDYGAANAANYVRKAQVSCASINEPELYDCSKADRSVGEARRDAMTALDSYAMFQRYCSEDRGKTKCEELFDAAYRLAVREKPSSKDQHED
ncbi:hypothetical protein ACSFBI_32065 [Variovorax sp. RB3P1]|uniref:hypothetical protein n=1 Tax=Variovorax sp. RB3P1 TaxID=3443732 RepID=UPI003F4766E8